MGDEAVAAPDRCASGHPPPLCGEGSKNALRPHPRWRPLYAAGCRWGRCGDTRYSNSQARAQRGGRCLAFLAFLASALSSLWTSPLPSSAWSRPWRRLGGSWRIFLGILARSLAFLRFSGFGWAVERPVQEWSCTDVSRFRFSFFPFLARCARSGAFGLGRVVTRPPAARIVVSTASGFAIRALSAITELRAALAASTSAWVGLSGLVGLGDAGSVSSCAGPWNEASPSSP